MIDRRVFVREWTALCERFSRQHNAREASRYYEWLNSRLSTEDFELAARDLYARAEFFPRPEAFVEAVRGKRGGPWVQPQPPHVKLLPPPPPEDAVTGAQVREAFEAAVPEYAAWREARGS